MAYTRSLTITVANGQTKSAVVHGGDHSAWAIQVPSTFDGTAITFEVSADNPVSVADGSATFQALYDNTGTTQISMAVTASRSYDLPPELSAWPRWKIVCGTSQTGATDFVVVGKAP